MDLLKIKEETQVKTIIYCSFLDAEGKPRGREYTYFTEIPVKEGDYVNVEVLSKGASSVSIKKVLVTKVDVDEKDIKNFESFKDVIKTILGIVPADADEGEAI